VLANCVVTSTQYGTPGTRLATSSKTSITSTVHVIGVVGTQGSVVSVVSLGHASTNPADDPKFVPAMVSVSLPTPAAGGISKLTPVIVAAGAVTVKLTGALSRSQVSLHPKAIA
jgi:hypothetical protein